MNQILAALDLSSAADEVIRHAESLTRAMGARLTLLHVAAPHPDFVGYQVGPQSVRDARARELKSEHDRLQSYASDLQRRGLDAHAILVEGPTVETILAEVDRRGADLIVMGSHGHGMLYDAIVGSVSAGVMRAATRPVLIVPDFRDPRKQR